MCSNLITAFLILLVVTLLVGDGAKAQSAGETLLTTENAYNPIPSPDGKYILRYQQPIMKTMYEKLPAGVDKIKDFALDPQNERIFVIGHPENATAIYSKVTGEEHDWTFLLEVAQQVC